MLIPLQTIITTTIQTLHIIKERQTMKDLNLQKRITFLLDELFHSNDMEECLIWYRARKIHNKDK